MRKGVILLSLGIFALILLFAASAVFAQYSLMATVTYTGVDQDRGIAVNANAGSPCHGYLYASDGTAGARIVRVLRPDPEADGVNATSYVEIGTMGYNNAPGGALFMNVFVGEDDTVWVVDYSGKAICTGSPTGGDLTVQFTTPEAPRSVWVKGPLGQAGTKAFVAESTWASPAFIDKCEVYEYDGANWTLAADLGTLGVVHPFSVTGDSAGNSYWIGNMSGATNPGVPFITKVKPDLTVDTSFTFTKPDFLGNNWISCAVTCVQDPTDQAHPEYLYVTGYGPGSCMRFDLNGNYIDGYGQTYNMPGTPPAGTWTPFSLDPSGGNNFYWVTADDAHNTYVVCRTYDSSNTLFNCVTKMHLPFVPDPPTDLAASNDIYGQVKLQWTPPVPRSPFDPVGSYKIYRSTDTTKPADPYATVFDAYPKWKDAEQGQTAGGPFYYWVTAAGFTGESPSVGPVGPIAPTVSTAPAPRSKNAAVSYSEVTRTDTVEVANYDDLWPDVSSFLDIRGVDYTVVYDADTAYPNIENDDIAGHTLLILPLNRCMSSYTAQCIKDYVKYSGGRLFTGYWNSLADANTNPNQEFQLADIYRVNYAGWDGDWVSSTHPWNLLRYRYLMPEAGDPAADVIFSGLQAGVTQPGTGTISMLATPYTDGTAAVVGKWFAGDKATNPFAGDDPRNAGLIVGKIGGEPVCVYTHLLWWFRTAECHSGGTISATKLTENILSFFGVPFTPVPAGLNMGASKEDFGDGSAVGYENVVITEILDNPVAESKQVYIETQDRSSGIKAIIPPVLSAMYLSTGQLITLSGLIDSEYETNPDESITWGDRIVKTLEIMPGEQSEVPKPLFIGNRDLVGAWSSNWHQNGAWVGSGLNNLGIYARTLGKVTYVDSAAIPLFFYIDDGAGLQDGTTHDDGAGSLVPNVGVRILIPWWTFAMPPAGFDVGAYVGVTGCTALELVGLGGDNGVRAMRFADWNQVGVLN